jgi:anti-sigma factor (TIGR02949 family)
MDCKAIQQVIFRFIYGESSADELRKIKAHLDRCGDCKAEGEVIAEILEKLKGALPDEPVPDGFRERMLARIQAVALEEGG